MLRVERSAPQPPRPGRGVRFPAPARETLALFAVAFALRALVAVWATRSGLTPSSAESAATAIAASLAHGGGFRLGLGEHAAPTAIVPPVLPLLLSLVDRVGGSSALAARLLLAALGALVPLALAGFARSTWGSGVARIAGWIAALHPLLVTAGAQLTPGAPFALAVTLAAWASADWVKTPRPGRALGTGILWGIAALTLPAALPVPLVVIAWAWWPLGLTLASGDRVRQSLFLPLGAALAVAPWTLRNARVLQAFVPVSDAGTLAPASPVGLLARFVALGRPPLPPDVPVAALAAIGALEVAVLALALVGVVALVASPKRLFLALPLLAAAVLAIAGLRTALTDVAPALAVLLSLHAAVGVDAVWTRWRLARNRMRLVRGGGA